MHRHLALFLYAGQHARKTTAEQIHHRIAAQVGVKQNLRRLHLCARWQALLPIGPHRIGLAPMHFADFADIQALPIQYLAQCGL